MESGDRKYSKLAEVVDGRKYKTHKPYNARHAFVSWSLMVGKNLLWLAKQLGHSVQSRTSRRSK